MKVLEAYVADLEKGLESSLNLNKAQATRGMNNTFCKNCHRIPSQCCCAPAKTLTDEEIDEIASMCSVNEKDQINDREFARAILKKASEK